MSQKRLSNLEKGAFQNVFAKSKEIKCGSGKIDAARNCGYAQMEKIACTVFQVFTSTRVEECSEVRLSKLCKLLFLPLLLCFFFTLLLSFIAA